jgi:hypothetical protein
MKLYKHAISYKWTVDELISTIKLIKSTDFKVEDVNIDLHKREVWSQLCPSVAGDLH